MTVNCLQLFTIIRFNHRQVYAFVLLHVRLQCKEGRKEGKIGLVWFYGISTIVGYLMPNPFYTYKIYVICKHILQITFLNEPELIFFLHVVKWFHLFLSNMNNSIYQ